MMDSLKRGLIENEVDFTETLFTSADSISGLGEEPYVRGKIELTSHFYA